MDRPKMRIKKSVDEFIEGARGDRPEGKEKTFLLRLPYDVWKEAKKRALEEDMTLQDFILKCIRENI